MNVYLLPGLGYDHRIFGRLDFKNIQPIPLNWIEPKHKESIDQYAKRMAQDIPERSKKVTLIGHSLGGIMAQEIANIRKVEKVILIGSIQSRAELPFYFKMIAPLRLHKLFTKELCIRSIPYWGKNHGFVSNEDQDLFKSMLGQQSNNYLQWAFRQLSIWQKTAIPEHTKVFHIHGKKDKTLPFRLVQKPDFPISDGGHIISYRRPEEVSAILNNLLQSSRT